MLLSEDLLLQHGGEIRTYEKDDLLFEQGGIPRYYFQLKKGKVSIQTLNASGRILTQDIIWENNKKIFGLGPILADTVYPAQAYVHKTSELIKIPVSNLNELLLEHPQEAFELLKILGKRLQDKVSFANTLSLSEPKERILHIFEFFVQHKDPEQYHRINLTRQEIANLTALRVETVIRAILSMEEDGLLQIKKHKVYFKSLL